VLGDKRLEMPKTHDDMDTIINLFNLAHGTSATDWVNTRRIVELNNELYDKLHTECNTCRYQKVSPDEFPCNDCIGSVSTNRYEHR
jgi:hypothetical protein